MVTDGTGQDVPLRSGISTRQQMPLAFSRLRVSVWDWTRVHACQQARCLVGQVHLRLCPCRCMASICIDTVCLLCLTVSATCLLHSSSPQACPTSPSTLLSWPWRRVPPCRRASTRTFHPMSWSTSEDECVCGRGGGTHSAQCMLTHTLRVAVWNRMPESACIPRCTHL